MWKWLNGKKTVIGIVAKALVNVAAQLKPEWSGFMRTAETYIDMWILGGVTHKLAKME